MDTEIRRRAPSRTSWLVAFGSGVVAAIATALGLDDAGPDTAESERLLSEMDLSEQGRILATGLSYSSLDSEGATIELAVDRVVDRKRRLGPLSVGGANDLILKRVRLTLPPRPNGSSQTEEVLEFLDVATNVLGLAEALGRDDVTRVFIEQLSIDALSSSGWHVLAERARVDAGSQQLTLLGGVSISTSGGQRLDARKVRLDNENSAFEVVGSYQILEGEQSVESGADATFVVDGRGYLTRLRD